MTPPTADPTALDFLKEYSGVLIPIITFIMGFVVSRFTMTLKEKKDVAQKMFENGKELMEAQNERFQEFSAVLQKFINLSGEPTLDDFYNIATVGENYFYQQKVTSNAILTGKVDSHTRDSTLVPSIKETVEKSLPVFYSTLQSIAKKQNIEYSGQLKKENYKSMYAVVAKFT